MTNVYMYRIWSRKSRITRITQEWNRPRNRSNENLSYTSSQEIALGWMPKDLTDDQSTLVQVMAWCYQATSTCNYLSQCGPRSMSHLVSLAPMGKLRGRVMYICVSKVTLIGSENGLSPDWRQTIIWTNAGILSIRSLGTNCSEILCEIHTFPFKKMHLKMSSAKWRAILSEPQCVNWDWVMEE